MLVVSVLAYLSKVAGLVVIIVTVNTKRKFQYNDDQSHEEPIFETSRI